MTIAADCVRCSFPSARREGVVDGAGSGSSNWARSVVVGSNGLRDGVSVDRVMVFGVTFALSTKARFFEFLAESRALERRSCFLK